MANKKVSQLVSKPSVLVTDLFPIADPTTGQLFKTTISDLGTAIGSGVSSVNTLVGAVVLDTDDIQELASPTNRWFTDTRARAALSASSPLAYNSGTGVFSIPAATSSQDGYLSSADWTTFNAKQAALSGTGFVKISGTTISYDNSTYLTTSAAASTYLALAGGTLTGALNGTSATFTGDLTLSASNPRLYFTDTDNNPDYFISNTDGTFTIYDVTNSQSRFTIGSTGNGTFGGNLTVGQIIRSGGTSSQFLKADGSVDSTAYVSGSGTSEYYARFTGTRVISDGFIRTTSNITYVEGMGLYTLNGLDINGNYGAGGGGLKIRSYDETTGNAYIDFASTGGRMYLGLNRSTASGLMTNATAYATVLTTGLGTTNLEFGTNATKRLTIDGTTGAATFTSSVTTTGVYLPGMTSGSGALYYSSGANRVTVANYNTSGIVVFEVNGGAAALTLNANLSASFASSLTSTNVIVNNIGSTASYFSSSNGSTTSGAILIGANAGGDFNLFNPNATPIRFFTNGTENVRIASGGIVGINETNPTEARLVINNPSGSTNSGVSGNTLFLKAQTANANLIRFSGAIATDLIIGRFGNADAISIGTTGGTEIARFLSSGNVGIGTTSPSRLLHLVNGTLWVQNAGSVTNPSVSVNNDDCGLYSPAINTLGFTVNSGERMRITSGGQVLINTTTDTYSRAAKLIVNGAESVVITGFGNAYGVGLFMVPNSNATGTHQAILFRSPGNGSTVGSIETNSSSTSYITSSDYRLKEDLKPIKGLEIVNKIKVYDYKWKAENSRMDGVLAHELAEVLPYAVHGVKDGDEMQGVDYSKIVPVLIQAIKDQQVQIEQLKNK